MRKRETLRYLFIAMLTCRFHEADPANGVNNDA